MKSTRKGAFHLLPPNNDADTLDSSGYGAFPLQSVLISFTLNIPYNHTADVKVRFY